MIRTGSLGNMNRKFRGPRTGSVKTTYCQLRNKNMKFKDQELRVYTNRSLGIYNKKVRRLEQEV